MKYTVYYSRLSDERIAILNDQASGGWDCAPWASRYADVMMLGIGDKSDEIATKIYNAAKLKLYEPAARFDCESDNPEHIWTALQNVDYNWHERGGPTCLTDFPRSMMLGDVILSEAGSAKVAVSFGFEPIDGKAFLAAVQQGNRAS